MGKLSGEEIRSLDPYALLASLGKRVIHPGGKRSTEQILEAGAFSADQRVLDVGCGVATTAIEIARRFGSHVTAVDIAPLMLERARANVETAGVGHLVSVEHGDILKLGYADGAFDRVLAEAVTMFVDRRRAVAELGRVCASRGLVLATEFLWRETPPEEARHAFLGEVCPGMTFDTLDDWVELYRDGGLGEVDVQSGPFAMMTPRGFLADEGVVNSAAIIGRVLARPAYIRKMSWLMPRIGKAVPYLGYIVIRGRRGSSGRTSSTRRLADRSTG